MCHDAGAKGFDLNSLRKQLPTSPAFVRVLPFAIFVTLTFLQGKFGEELRYWIYFLKMIVGAWLIWLVWPLVREMRWKISWEAVLVGVAVFAIWVGLDNFYPKFFKPALAWNPQAQYTESPMLAWFFVAVRIIGVTLVVPPIEEIFYRSFLYRYISQADFDVAPLNYFNWRALAAVSLFFGFAHREWIAGILCGLAYQWIVIRKNRLGDAMTAHAITNLLLGIWVVWKDAWHFW